MAKHDFSIPARGGTLSVLSWQCLKCGIIVATVDGKIPEDIVNQECEPQKPTQ